MKLKAPEGVSAFSHQGVELTFDQEGCVEAESPEVVVALKDHGFSVVSEPVKHSARPVVKAEGKDKDKDKAADKDKKE